MAPSSLGSQYGDWLGRAGPVFPALQLESKNNGFCDWLGWHGEEGRVNVSCSPLFNRASSHLTLLFQALVQTSLGIGTLWSLVRTEVAALHQVGSVLLLTVALHYAHDVRRILRRLH